MCAAVDALSKRRGEGYEDAVRRAAADPIAAKVKAADIADNSEPDRLALLDLETAERLTRKYEAARELLKRLTAHTHSPERQTWGDGWVPERRQRAPARSARAADNEDGSPAGEF